MSCEEAGGRVTVALSAALERWGFNVTLLEEACTASSRLHGRQSQCLEEGMGIATMSPCRDSMMLGLPFVKWPEESNPLVIQMVAADNVCRDATALEIWIATFSTNRKLVRRCFYLLYPESEAFPDVPTDEQNANADWRSDTLCAGTVWDSSMLSALLAEGFLPMAMVFHDEGVSPISKVIMSKDYEKLLAIGAMTDSKKAALLLGKHHKWRMATELRAPIKWKSGTSVYIPHKKLKTLRRYRLGLANRLGPIFLMLHERWGDDCWLAPAYCKCVEELFRIQSQGTYTPLVPFPIAWLLFDKRCDGETETPVAVEFGMLTGRCYTSISGMCLTSFAGTVQMVMMGEVLKRCLNVEFIDWGMVLGYKMKNLRAKVLNRQQFIKRFRDAASKSNSLQLSIDPTDANFSCWVSWCGSAIVDTLIEET